MPDKTHKLIELVGSSEVSLEDAIRNALEGLHMPAPTSWSRAG